MRKIIVSLLLVGFFLSGCVFHRLDAQGLIHEMNNRQLSKSSRINILWYQGHDEKFDYFAYVYSMFGTTKFKVPVGQFVMNQDLHFSDDSEKWVGIKSIGEIWHASRLHDKTWSRDENG